MGSYVTVRGLRTYYEVQGEGEPLLLLHGGGVTADSWYAQLPVLAQHYRVYVPERRGHGRTPDVDGPISFPLMADDTAAFIEELGLGPVRVVGWSDGGIVAIHLTLRRPDLVSRQVLIGAGVTMDGATEATLELVSDANRDVLTQMFYGPYAALSPDGPAHFPVVLEKLMRMWQAGPLLQLEDLSEVTTPTLVMQGDHDGTTVEHSLAMTRTLPDAQLAVVPGASHALPLEKPELVNLMLLDFLREEQQMLVFPLS
ncbi:alpha/beta hydrolase [Kitasatospora sp. NBC_01250]|uniref:alpha/beta fold hydrolase n=1 Tax=Kitasatospora sp. NBC_01250 TaxID=2903571 RepID=UPI002E3157E3|nr:alpha/beta hydrolase [Kitasatospora sp. NBC_01250]